MKNLILASGSPRRRELMSQVGLDFTVVTSDADENIKEMEPEDYVRELSSIKAQSVLEQYTDKEDAVIVIGADTIVYHKGEILTKPKDEEDAFRILKSLEGEIHQVYTGVTICSAHKNVSFYEKTDVWVYDMTDEEIRDYINTGEPMDKAGAYGIQGKFAAYIKGIEGDYNNVVGLPVARLVHELKVF
ncbi:MULTISPECIES: Maf family protein [Clostridia]|jgi:septum formation protein|uniref:Maf family protein n=1 Tax=Clostridia TaxID=186801 RepID=UPI000E5D8AB3|nr:Maf family protein [Eubacterium sp. AF22-9]RGS30281.1 septum formation protein Maf [Eubacterium sp. AF22-9]HAS06707.1 septum formation protein Maf [Eubacterium sp.]HCO35265.1 septum formation protein Maf [Eubacterium sp.]